MQVQIHIGGQSVTHGSGPSSSPTISTTTNRVTALGGSNYYYDSNGSLTQDDLFKYKYDAENRVVEIRNLSDTLLTSYAYDGHSMQVIKVAAGTRTWFLYAGGQLVSEYYDVASNTYSSPTSPGSAPSDSVSTLLYQHADHLTTRVTTDNAGTLSNQQAHYPYGENWYATGTADPSVKRKFTSYRKETDSSLTTGQINYAIARYHGARIGRFHRPDPVRGNFRSPQRLNRYAYVTNNPVRYIDPKGRDMVDPASADAVWQGEGPVNPGVIVWGGGLMTNPNSYGGGGGGMSSGLDDPHSGLSSLLGTGGGGSAMNYHEGQNSYMDWLNNTPNPDGPLGMGLPSGTGGGGGGGSGSGGGFGGGGGVGIAFGGNPVWAGGPSCEEKRRGCLAFNREVWEKCMQFNNNIGTALGTACGFVCALGPSPACLDCLTVAGVTWSGTAAFCGTVWAGGKAGCEAEYLLCKLGW